jgi:hypothetical protein
LRRQQHRRYEQEKVVERWNYRPDGTLSTHVTLVEEKVDREDSYDLRGRVRRRCTGPVASQTCVEYD